MKEKVKEREKGTATSPCSHRSHLRPASQILRLPVLGRLPPLQRHRHPVRGGAHALPLQLPQGKALLNSNRGGNSRAWGQMLRCCFPSQRANDREHSVRLAIGNGMRAAVWKEFLQRFGPVSISEFYGATEGNAGFINYTGKIGAVGRANVFLKVSR